MKAETVKRDVVGIQNTHAKTTYATDWAHRCHGGRTIKRDAVGIKSPCAIAHAQLSLPFCNHGASSGLYLKLACALHASFGFTLFR